VSDAVEQLEEIALCGVEREIANVKTRRRDFNPFGFARGARRLRAIARLCRSSFSRRRSRKIRNPLPKRLFLRLRRFLLSSERVPDFLCVGPHRAGGVSVFRVNKSSC